VVVAAQGGAEGELAGGERRTGQRGQRLLAATAKPTKVLSSAFT
jgi:hypothetical protein